MLRIKGKRNILLLTAILAVIGVAVFALPALAQVDLGIEYGTELGLTTTDIRVTIGRIINAFLGLLGIVAVLIILYAGFLWMTAGGDAGKIETAKKWIINGVIGLIIILSSYAIASFILRAVTGEEAGTPGPGGSTCPPGQTCSIIPGGTGGFRVQSIVPYGPGPGEDGWPKNYAIVASFNSAVAASTVTSSSFVVWQCNPRVDGGGDPQPFVEADCDTVVSGTRTIEENRITFKPDSSPEDDPTDFEGEFWYMVRVVGGDVTDTSGRILICPFNPPGEEGDISSVRVERDLCDRAAAFNDLRDVEPPTVRIDSPASAPAYCADSIPVIARAADDFLPARVDFRLDGGTDGLVNGDGDPMSSESNADLDNPFFTDEIFIDATVLIPGTTYTLSATAWDPAPWTSLTAEREFTIAFAHCCNGLLDESLGETGVDCGGECGACGGGVCTEDADCASGFCNPATGRCENRPVIEDMDPGAAGVGSIITISGQFFGATAGTVVFLGDEAVETDDVVAVACAPSAWSDTEIAVAVPVGAVSGPLEVFTSSGATDRTDDDHGPMLGAFVVNSDVLPGICWLEPATGTFGQSFVIHGAGFGLADPSSYVRMDGVTTDIAMGGWSADAITAITPSTLAEGVYPVRVVVGSQQTNTVDFTLRRTTAEDGPRIVDLTPDDGSVGTYVTISGSGFGTRQGVVRFNRPGDTALAGEPACDDSWHDNYIVVKVPGAYIDGSAIALGVYEVEVETAAPALTSNAVVFTINDDPLAPGLCSIAPDNGPPGTRITLAGEAFGVVGPSLAPENLVRFYVDATHTMPVDLPFYGGWDDTGISAVVPGDFTDRATWPNSGPVHVVADNVPSSNSIPFMVQDCNDGGACAEGTSCCSNGVCQASCEPIARDSAFGWWLSTDVLPAWPQVVRRSFCDADSGLIQSPTPYPGVTNACKNALIGIEFTVDMESDSFVPDTTFIVEECGNGDAASCPEGAAGIPIEMEAPVMDGAIMRFSPTIAYPEAGHPDAGTGYFKEGFWYEATLISDPEAGTGIRDTEGRFLDGDFDRKPGGDYSWKFKVSTDRETCAVDSLSVLPARYVIDHDGSPPSPEGGAFTPSLFGGNCNLLACEEPALAHYDIVWYGVPGLPDPVLDLLDNGGDHCIQAVQGFRETGVDESSLLVARLEPDGEALDTSGSAEVSVNFADPRVIETFPTDGCVEACTNASVGALFNIGMNEATFTLGDNIRMFRCRNESCNPPFEPIGVARSVTNITETGERVVGATDEKVVGFELTGVEPLLPATYYIVMIAGGEDGTLSSSQVPLTGLNSEGWYRWTFRTKADATECGVSRTEIAPESATLYYLGQRLGLTATPYGPPDDCSAEGQRLQASAYNWEWSIDPNPVLEGFIRVTDDYDPFNPAFGWTRGEFEFENTAPAPEPGCTSNCLLLGSRSGVPQCGNGVIDIGEDCDPALVGEVACSSRCLWNGTEAPTCGDGDIDPGEECEAARDEASGERMFPPGCEEPTVDGFGCVWLGATAAGSDCGNGLISDGEDCDDGNRSEGDGCSSECLHEGTLPICSADGGTDCVSVCGDGIVQPGEDANCDTIGGGAIAAGCTLDTCRMSGTTVTCGNSVIDPGEECDDHNLDDGDGCSDSCLFEGSSVYYATPSFCGDGFIGPGEHPLCEDDSTPDLDIDSYQAVTSLYHDPLGGAGSMSAVRASTGGLLDDDIGRSFVTLSCTCGAATDPDAHCEMIALRFMVPEQLGCSDSGCCVARPAIASVHPGGGLELSCRNAPVEVTFTSLMDETSVKQGLYIGFDNYDYDAGAPVACPEGTTALPDYVAVADLTEEPGFFRRVWNRIASFFLEHIVYPVFGAPPAGVPYDDHNNYCTVDGQIVTRTSGEGADAVTIATFTPRFGFPADKWIRVLLTEDAESADGVSAIGSVSYFSTPSEPDICGVARVSIDPESDLFSSREEDTTHTYMAMAYAADGTRITEVEGQYEWDWVWTGQSDSGPIVSPIVVGQLGDPSMADVWVRGTHAGDVMPADYAPMDGEAVVEAAAVVKRTLDGALEEADWQSYYGRSNVVVMLCDNPWPAWQTCSLGSVSLPWAGVEDCTGFRVWYPFFDAWSNTKFYYCRDASSAGDSAPALPAIKMDNADDVVRLISPAPGIFREYLFTFDTALGPVSTANDWSRDAIGLRIMGNSEHLGIADWYADRGFRGSPAPLAVSGYDALQEGRTVYVNAGAVSDTGAIYTNVNVLSFNDGAAAETVSVFNQILNRIDFNRNIDETGICRVGIDPAEPTASCVSDLGCGAGETCDVPKMKLARDVRRWADMHSMRDDLLRGSLPQLVEGTFLRSRTYSAWPSWQTVLGGAVGTELSLDPLNLLAPCPPVGEGEAMVTYDQDTCWSAPSRQFQCNADSHIYGYRSVAGIADMFADLEYLNVGGALAGWNGGSCIEKATQASCEAAAASQGCVWSGGSCNYSRARFNLGGLNVAMMCAGAAIGSEGVCGDGVVNDGETCELGARQSVPCSGAGVQEQVCRADCRGWDNVGDCVEARCGDGIIQCAAPGPSCEVCDDGSLNGTYGHCGSTCMSFGMSCGDGQPHPSERCDCGTLNGQYYRNGVLAPLSEVTGLYECGVPTSNTGTCSWDCSGPGPRCGDGIVNGSEKCDGGSQETKSLCSVANTACNSDSDCLAPQTCTRTCPAEEQRYRRSCNPNNPAITTDDNAACNWSAWACTAPGSCGNGTRDTGEECDDGNENNGDACTNTCDNNVCGDGFVNTGVEACDNGPLNNVPCTPEYGRTCNYCTSACRLGTVSGGYCGDGDIQTPMDAPPGPESCEPVTGLTGDWVCVSTKEEDQSFGAQTGRPVCSAATCVPACAAPNSEACFAGSSGDTDTTSCPPGGGCVDYEWCDFIAPELGGIAGGTTRDSDEAPSESWISAYEFCLDRQRWMKPSDEDNYPYSDISNDCDPDDDNDGVPDMFDCASKDPAIHPARTIPGTGIVIEAAPETCNPADENCNGSTEDFSEEFFKMDIVFAFDLSGSMGPYIKGIANTIEYLVDRGAVDDTGHNRHYGYVTFGQDITTDLVIDNTGHTHYFMDMTGDVDTFITKVQELADMRTAGTITKGGTEPMFEVAYALMEGKERPEWRYGLTLRPDARPYVIVVGNEDPTQMTGLKAVSIADIEDAITNCAHQSCDAAAGREMYLFAIGGSSYIRQWSGAIDSSRYLNIEEMDDLAGGIDEDNPPDIVEEFASSVLAVCPEE